MDSFINWPLLKNPANWVVIWSMLLIAWFIFATVKRGVSAE